jgi:phage terminase small subunit
MGKVVSLSKIQETSKRVNGKPLTMKQAIFTQEYLKEPNATKSAKKAYPGRKNIETTRAIASENLQKPTIQRTTLAIMEEIGLTDEFLSEKLYDDIEAKPQNRARELELAIKWKTGTLKDNVNIANINLSDEQIARLLGQ